MSDIDLKNLTKSFGQGNAVADISLAIKAGSFTCILGPSGCGKTTLLRMIAGLERASAGQISIGGRVVDDAAQNRFVPPDQRGVGLVFQSYALWPHMTVAQNVAFGLSLQRQSARQRAKRTDEMLVTLRISDLADRYPAQLSGGQQQRVALARTMALAPQVLLLDEPLSNLDAALRLAMRAELAHLHRSFGTTIVFVTHDQWEAMTLATDIIVLADGAVQQMGSASEVYDQPASRFVAEFVGNPPINIFLAGSPAARALIPPQVLGADGITAALRPEAMDVAALDSPAPKAAHGGAVLGAHVVAVIPTGGSWIVEMALNLGGASVLQATSLRPSLSARQPVTITPHATGLHFFAPDGRRWPIASPAQKENP
jgi:iron(III) transport system ATP-binding protein